MFGQLFSILSARRTIKMILSAFGGSRGAANSADQDSS